MIRNLTETLTFPLWTVLARLHGEDKAEAVCQQGAQGMHQGGTGGAIGSDDAIAPCMCRPSGHSK